MKELARKGNVNINKTVDGVFCIKRHISSYPFYHLDLTLEELSDLKDCISQVTAKKTEVEKDTNGVLYFRCPDCSSYVDRDDGYCLRCGLKLEGVEE